MADRDLTKTVYPATGKQAASTRPDRPPALFACPHADLLNLQRASGNWAVNQLLQPKTNVDRVPPIVVRVLKSGGGRPLDPATRSFMESRFGEDFSQVKVHTDPFAADSARAIGAQAYTVNRHVVFAPAYYAPQTIAGRALLAHEFAHVLQQQDGRANAGTAATGDLTAQWEAQADQVGRHVSDPSPILQSNGQNSRGSIAANLTPAPMGTLQAQFVTPHAAGGGFGGLLERDRRAAYAEGSAVDPAYAEIVLTIQGGWRMIAALDEPTLRRATVDQRVAMLTQLMEAYWTGSAEEEAIIRILSTTPSSDASTLVERLDATLEIGRSLLDELDRVVDFGNNLDLHTEISRLRLRAMPSKQGIEALHTAPVLPWHDVMGFTEDAATFEFWSTEQGKIRVRYLRGEALLSSADFAAEIQRLPQDLFVSGHDYESDQFLIIHDYDKDQFIPAMARDLLGYRNAGIRGFLSHAVGVASLALPGGTAKTVVGKAAFMVLERVLPAAAVMIGENRLNIVRWFPKWGPRMLYFADLVQFAIGVYGIARFAVAGARLIESWREVRNARAALEGAALDPEAETVARQLEGHFDEIAKELEKVRESGQSAAQRVVPGEASPAEQTGGKLLSLEGRTRTGTFEGLRPGEQEVTSLSEFKARKVSPPSPSPSEPSLQAMPQELEEEAWVDKVIPLEQERAPRPAAAESAQHAAEAEVIPLRQPKQVIGGETVRELTQEPLKATGTRGPVAMAGGPGRTSPPPAVKVGPPSTPRTPQLAGGRGGTRAKPLEGYQSTEYGRFGIPSRRGDPFEGHEIVLNLWLKTHGFITRRGAGLSRFNSAIALTVKQHKRVSELQRVASLYNEAVLAKMSAREVITKNAEILLQAGVPEEKVIALIDDAFEMLPKIGP